MRNDAVYLEHILDAVWEVTQQNLPMLKRAVVDMLRGA